MRRLGLLLEEQRLFGLDVRNAPGLFPTFRAKARTLLLAELKTFETRCDVRLDLGGRRPLGDPGKKELVGLQLSQFSKAAYPSPNTRL